MAAQEKSLDLDREEEVRRIDKSGILDTLKRFPEQCREAIDSGMALDGLPGGEGIDSVFVVGMGGSGISGDVVGSLVAEDIQVPFQTVKGYHLPASVSSRSLVFAVSYSGNTEETLNALEEAQGAGASIVAVTSGGELAEVSDRAGFPRVKVPVGYQPRAALGYLFFPILVALEKMGLVHGMVEKAESSLHLIGERSREYSVDRPLKENPAKRLAVDLEGFVPVVYGSEGPLAVAALRWKTQFNENSKIPAFANAFSELNHNETVGWQNLPGICSKFHLLILRHDTEPQRIQKRIEVTAGLIEESVGRQTQVWARGENMLEKMLDLIYLGDFTSVYLALLLGEDPTPVERIERLKKELAKS